MRHLCDVNILIALLLDRHPHHSSARAWFDALGSADSAEVCRVAQNSLLRLLTTKALMTNPGAIAFTNAEAIAAYQMLCTDSCVRFCQEPPGLEPMWLAYAGFSTAAPLVWADAYLAAFARAAHMRLVTFDTGFRSFEGLDLLLLSSVRVPSP